MRSVRNSIRRFFVRGRVSDASGSEEHPQNDSTVRIPPEHSDVSFGSTSLIVDIPVGDDSAQSWTTGDQRNEPITFPNAQVHINISEATSAGCAQPWTHLGPKPSVRSVYTGRSVGSRIERKPSIFRGLFLVDDNRVALKLFGSRIGIQREEERLKNCGHCVIHPCSRFRLVYLKVVLPLRAYSSHVFSLPI